MAQYRHYSLLMFIYSQATFRVVFVDHEASKGKPVHIVEGVRPDRFQAQPFLLSDRLRARAPQGGSWRLWRGRSCGLYTRNWNRLWG